MKIVNRLVRRASNYCDRAGKLPSARAITIGTLRKLVPALMILAFNPYHLLDHQAEISNKIVMAATAPFYPAPQSSVDRGQSRIATILFRQSDLDGESLAGLKSWPPTLEHYTTLLRKIAAHEPAMIFIDLNIGPHDTEGRGEFYGNLERLNRRVPIYVTRLPHDDDGVGDDPHSRDISSDPELKTKISGQILGKWHGFGENYPIRVLDEHNRWQLTPAAQLWRADLESRKGDPDFRDEDESARKWLAKLQADNVKREGEPVEEPEPMMVRWGSGLPPKTKNLVPVDMNCLPRAEGARWPDLKTSLSVLALGLSPSFSNTPTWNVVTSCPHHLTLSIQQLLDISESGAAADDAIRNRIVLIGADVVGVNDTWSSPVHGKIQGVLLHAMALDNLLNFDQDYLQDAPHSVVHALELAFDVLAMLVASFAVRRPSHLLLAQAEEKVGRRQARKSFCDWVALWLLIGAAMIGIAGGKYGGLPWTVLALPIGLWLVTFGLVIRRKQCIRWLHGDSERAWARVCLYLIVTAISGLGAFTAFVALSFILVFVLLSYHIAPVPWLFVVTVSLYATIGEPMLEAIEHLFGHEKTDIHPSPHSS